MSTFDEVPPMTDREAEELIDREEAIASGSVSYIAPPPVELLKMEYMPEPPPVIYVHELAKMDSREVYTDSEDCPLDGDFESASWQALAGVY